MKETINTSDINTVFLDYVRDLKDQVSLVKYRVTEMANKLDKIDEGMNTLEEIMTDLSADEDIDVSLLPPPDRKDSNIILFPGGNRASLQRDSQIFDSIPRRSVQVSSGKLVHAAPGTPLSEDIADYRHLLQRDGLILLAWDKRMTEMGERYTAYWVTSVAIPRFYASKAHPAESFFMARPNHKSYAAEDGIEFFGQQPPDLIVHVAPDLMMGNPRHGELRKAHIEILRQLGSAVDFDYKYLLTTDKKRNPPLGKSNNAAKRTGSA
jgi:hypothetical protein